MNILEIVSTPLNEANMHWNEADLDKYKSLQGLVTSNNGVYKSKKQKDFINGKWVKKIGKGNADELKKYFGVDITPGNSAIVLSGHYQWSEYGSRGLIGFHYVFEMDQYGVVNKWKVGSTGNLKVGSSPDPNKVKLQFDRPANVDISHLELSDEEEMDRVAIALGKTEGEYIGTKGDRHNFGTVVLKKTIPLDSYGERYSKTNSSGC